MYEQTGADFVMVGRAAMGNPFVFKNINHYMQTGEILPEPTIEERLAVMKRHIELMLEYKSERTALMEARKHTAWYIKGIRGASKIRKMCGEITSVEDIERIAEMVLAENKNM